MRSSSSDFIEWIQKICDNNEIMIMQINCGISYSDCFRIDDMEIDISECIIIYSENRIIKIDLNYRIINYNEYENEYFLRWDNGNELLISSSL